MRKVRRNLDTLESRKFWANIDRVQEQINLLPMWMQKKLKMGRKKCKTCDGIGKVINPKYVGKNVMFFEEPHDFMVVCPDCGGTGERGRHIKEKK